MKGWISIHRSITSHWLYPKGRPFTKYEAWITILLEVNHTDKKESKGFNLIECKRGESINSLDTWAKLFHWNKSKVRRFFIMLQNDSMIETKSVQKTTHLKVCNYDSYQDQRNDSETKLKRKRNDSETELTPNNNVNKENNVNNDNKKDTYTEIRDIFNSVCINLPKIQKITVVRKKLIDARTKEYNLLTIGNVFNKVNESSFLNGENENGWVASFDWIFKASNFIKILEDNYKNRSNGNKKERTGELFDEIRRQHPDL